MEPEPFVVVVDDDASVRRALDNLLRSSGWQVRLFATALEFLDAPRIDAPYCLVLDVRMPGLSGLELQQRLATEEVPPPLVFITGHGDIAMAVQAMHRGAVEFLTKPFRDEDLLQTISGAVALHREARRRAGELSVLRARFSTLTPREREVLVLVARGLANKEIAAALDVSEATVKVHRGHVTRKMRAPSVAELVTICLALRIVPGRPWPAGLED